MLPTISPGCSTRWRRHACLFEHIAAITIMYSCYVVIYFDQITWTALPVPILVRLSKDPLVRNYDLSSLSTIFVGAAPVAAGISQVVNKILVSCCIRQGRSTRLSHSRKTLLIIMHEISRPRHAVVEARLWGIGAYTC